MHRQVEQLRSTAAKLGNLSMNYSTADLLPNLIPPPDQGSNHCNGPLDAAVEAFYTLHAGTKLHLAKPAMHIDQIFDLLPDAYAVAKAITFGNVDPTMPKLHELVRIVDRPQAGEWREPAKARLTDRVDPKVRRKAMAALDRHTPHLFFVFD
jgi:hypothetical protein